MIVLSLFLNFWPNLSLSVLRSSYKVCSYEKACSVKTPVTTNSPFFSHLAPSHPILHLHFRPPPFKGAHFPPFKQGLGTQGSAYDISKTLVILNEKLGH